MSQNVKEGPAFVVTYIYVPRLQAYLKAFMPQELCSPSYH